MHSGETVQSAQEIIELLRLAGQERERDQARQVTLSRLTPRERQVLETLSEGLDNRAIAERLFISPETARTHVTKLLAKLNVESRLQAAIFAIENGIGSADLPQNGSTTTLVGDCEREYPRGPGQIADSSPLTRDVVSGRLQRVDEHSTPFGVDRRTRLLAAQNRSNCRCAENGQRAFLGQIRDG